MILPAVMFLAGISTFSTSAEPVIPAEGVANRVILHTKSGETKVYKFSDLDYMDFEQVAEPAVSLEVKPGTLTHNSVTLLMSGECEYFDMYYCPENVNMESIHGTYPANGEIELTNLLPESLYIVSVIPYDKYDIKGEETAFTFTTLPEPAQQSDPKIGDYFYSDGTWSDGGLISIDADGQNAVWKAQKPAPIEGKSVIGIVCVTDPSRIAPEDVADGYTHGYVISTRNITDPNKMNYNSYPESVWYGGYLSEGDETRVVKLMSSAYERVSGRVDTQEVLSKYPGTEWEDCPMFWQATQQIAPENTSGWFVPSAGQLWDCLANFCSGEVAELLKQDRTEPYDFTYNLSHTGVAMNIFEEFMKVYELVPAEDKDEIEMEDGTWPTRYISLRTSNRYESDSTIVFNISMVPNGFIEGMAAWRDEDCHARAFLAF